MDTYGTATECYRPGYRLEFTPFVGVMAALIPVASIALGMWSWKKDRLDIVKDRYMYYLKNSQYAISSYPWAPERCILVELVKVALLAVACLGMFGVVSKTTVIIFWFSYDIVTLLNLFIGFAFLILARREPITSVLCVLYPFLYSQIMFPVGLIRTFPCFINSSHLYAMSFYSLSGGVFWIIAIFVGLCVVKHLTTLCCYYYSFPLTMMMLLPCWFNVHATTCNSLFGLVTNGLVICSCIMAEGSLFRNLPEFVYIICGVIGFCVYAIYHQENPDMLENLSLPVTQLIIALLLLNLVLTVVYDGVVYSRSKCLRTAGRAIKSRVLNLGETIYNRCEFVSPLPDITANNGQHQTTSTVVNTVCYFRQESVASSIGNKSRCSICFEELKQDHTFASLDVCKHQFHTDCILRTLETGNQKCPLCRRAFNAENVEVLSNLSEHHQNRGLSSK